MSQLMDNTEKITTAARWIRESKHTTVFTGAGVSVESGIPPFRGENGLWNKYDPIMLDLDYFRVHPKESWLVIKEVFYDFFGQAKPNDAHKTIALLEKENYVKTVITQNIDNLHQEAGSKNVLEFHGTAQSLRCLKCHSVYPAQTFSFELLPPRCPHCTAVMKPDFIFFGEGIPHNAHLPSLYEAQVADVFLIIGTTGEVLPACEIPFLAKKNGARLIEINPHPSQFTFNATDIFLQGKATEMMNALFNLILSKP